MVTTYITRQPESSVAVPKGCKGCLSVSIRTVTLGSCISGRLLEGLPTFETSALGTTGTEPNELIGSVWRIGCGQRGGLVVGGEAKGVCAGD